MRRAAPCLIGVPVVPRVLNDTATEPPGLVDGDGVGDDEPGRSPGVGGRRRAVSGGRRSGSAPRWRPCASVAAGWPAAAGNPAGSCPGATPSFWPAPAAKSRNLAIAAALVLGDAAGGHHRVDDHGQRVGRLVLAVQVHLLGAAAVAVMSFSAAAIADAGRLAHTCPPRSGSRRPGRGTRPRLPGPGWRTRPAVPGSSDRVLGEVAGLVLLPARPGLPVLDLVVGDQAQREQRAVAGAG